MVPPLGQLRCLTVLTVLLQATAGAAPEVVAGGAAAPAPAATAAQQRQQEQAPAAEAQAASEGPAAEAEEGQSEEGTKGLSAFVPYRSCFSLQMQQRGSVAALLLVPPLCRCIACSRGCPLLPSHLTSHSPPTSKPPSLRPPPTSNPPSLRRPPNPTHHLPAAEPNDGNGADLPGYSWTQSLQECVLTVPVPPGTKGRACDVQIGRTRLRVGLKGQPPVLGEPSL